MTLDELAIHYGTDKASTGNGLTAAYENVLFLRRDFIGSLLEIGVHEGASLRMWRAWLPDAVIVGIDKKPETAQRAADFRVYIGEQGDRALLQTVATENPHLDVIIDDGSHVLKDQLISLVTLWPHLAPGGVYAIEDLCSAYLPLYGLQSVTITDLLQWLAARTSKGYPQRPVPDDLLQWVDLHELCNIMPSIEWVQIWRNIAFIGKAYHAE